MVLQGADVAVDEAVFGFIVFLVCTEHRVIVHPVSNGEIIVHKPATVPFYDFLFLTRVGVYDCGKFRIGLVAFVLAAPMPGFEQIYDGQEIKRRQREQGIGEHRNDEQLTRHQLDIGKCPAPAITAGLSRIG